MAYLHFHLKDYAVHCGSETIFLLRKEYYLLQYLYEHANQPFSREQLLDAVWPLEDPSDRTVDDHIYRLRKKLKSWSDVVTIDTVKGYGYQLTLNQETFEPSPLFKDKEFLEIIEHLLGKYHTYGEGKAIDTFLNQTSLGLTLPAAYEPIFAFMRGDLWWYIRDEQHPMNEKLYILVLIFQIISQDYKQTIKYIKNGLNQEVFAGQAFEAKTIGLLFAYVFDRQYSMAEEYMLQLSSQIAPELTDPKHSYFPFFHVIKMIFAFRTEQTDLFEATQAHMDAFLNDKPYQRELGIHAIIKGSFLIQNGDVEQGGVMIERGFEIIRKTRFVSHLFLAYDVALFLLGHVTPAPFLRQQLEHKRERLLQEYDHSKLLTEVKSILNRELNQSLC